MSRFPHRQGTLPNSALGLLFVCALAVFLLMEAVRSYRPDPLQAEKATAIQLMQKSLALIKAERLRSGSRIDPTIDTNETGMIGERYSDLTTTLGSLPSKRTSTNPLFAAAVVDMLDRANVRRGDSVAISFSSSFPALNVAVLSAASALDLKAVIVSSVGASMYGANDPRMTWLDMESLLKKNGVFEYQSAAASLGGIVDTKGGLDGTGVELGLLSIRRNHVDLLEEGGVTTQQRDIRRRLDLYTTLLNGAKPAVFINVGASQTALGNSPEAYTLATGLLERPAVSDDPERGVIFHMAERGVPVIHLLKIRSLAKYFSIPFDPAPSRKAGQDVNPGGAGYSRSAAFMTLFVLLFLMALSKYHYSARTVPYPAS